MAFRVRTMMVAGRSGGSTVGRAQVLTRHLSTNPTASASAARAVNRDRVCVIVGAGDATGSALARKFHKEGFAVACVRRNGDALDEGVVKELGEGCRGFGVDARKEDEIVQLFK